MQMQFLPFAFIVLIMRSPRKIILTEGRKVCIFAKIPTNACAAAVQIMRSHHAEEPSDISARPQKEIP